MSIVSDQGSNYESRIFKELCKLLEIHKTLQRMIRSYLVDDHLHEWDLNLGCLAAACRATHNVATKLLQA